MELSITYDQIQSSISKFSTVKNNLATEIENAISAINSYKANGLSIDTGSYEETLNNITSQLGSEKEQISLDCARIENYLQKISEKAQESINKSISAREAVSTFTASGETVKRA